MWRYLVGGLATLLMVAAGWVLFNGRARDTRSVLPAQPALATTAQDAATPLPDTVPEASDKTREQKRFDRYDKDRDGTVTRAEYLMARRKAFARLDANGDGQLSFDEWAVKAETKFAGADKDKSGGMNAAEFATTAVQRKPKRTVNCRAAAPAPAPSGEDEG